MTKKEFMEKYKEDNTFIDNNEIDAFTSFAKDNFKNVNEYWINSIKTCKRNGWNLLCYINRIKEELHFVSSPTITRINKKSFKEFKKDFFSIKED